MSLRLTTLGPPRVFQGDTEFADLPSQRLRFALLAYLAVEGEVPRESILGLFWPDRAAERARHALRQMLYELRQLLGEDWIEVGRDRIVVRAEVDAVAFEAAALAGRSAEALGLYGGPFLDGFALDNRAFEGWVDRRRAQLGRTHRRLRRERIEALLAGGDARSARRAAQEWVELDPLEDEASHALIRCLGLTGERVAALQYYEAYERQLAAELQVEPLEETRELVERIRTGSFGPASLADAASAAASGPPGSLVPPADTPARGLPARSAAGLDAGTERARSAAPATSAPAPAAPATSASADTAPGMSSHEASATAATSATSASSAPSQTQAPAAGPPVTDRERRARQTASATAGWQRIRVRPGAVAAAGLIAVLSIFALAYRTENPRIAQGTPGARVLILPFTDRTDDGSLVLLGDALTETLARNLAQSRPLDIVSPAGVALLRERGLSNDSVGRMLRADYLVSGSITRVGGRLRVDVDLLDGRTGSLVRSEVVERDMAESRILVEDVVERTAIILRREVGHQVEVQRVRASTSSEEAWRSVVEARALQESVIRLVRYGDLHGFERAMMRADSLLTRAGELDRRWAEPLVMRGWLMERRVFATMLATPGDTASKRKLLEAAHSLAERATERDRTEPRAYELRGAVLHQLALMPGLPRDTVRARLAVAEEELQRATQLDPNSASSWRRLAEVLNSAGRYAAAKSAAERAYRIDRYTSEANGIINLLFSTSLELGEDGEAERWCMEGRRLYSSQPPFIYCLFALHAWAERIAPDVPLLQRELDRYTHGRPVVQPELLARLETLLAVAYIRAGRPDTARAILQRTEPAAGDPGVLWLRAGAFGMLDDEPRAMAHLANYVGRGTWESYRVAQTRPFWRFQSRPDYQRIIGL